VNCTASSTYRHRLCGRSCSWHSTPPAIESRC